ncbi:MAG: ATP-binding cassette domain-containing protein, partial [Candidatus Omnitrophica bacterium]|nr:ATP-binding cassette domain-containing protein [Candidatus Omnitrophota bacterium]
MNKFTIRNLNIWFDATHALKTVNMEIEANQILSIIGPSNSGKTTFLRMLNRLNELHSNIKMTGTV